MLFLAVAALPAASDAAEFTATVARIKDGDSLVVTYNGKEIDIRLEGIE
jgi:endonuclease YncB( thermonuclease family)